MRKPKSKRVGTKQLIFNSMSKGKMSGAAAARIQSATAKSNVGSVPKGSFAARATSAAAKSSKK